MLDEVTRHVVWNDFEADRHNIVDDIRASGLKFGTAGDNHAFTFDTEVDASKFESMIVVVTKQKIDLHWQ